MITYPSFVENKLATNTNLRSALDAATSDFSGWLKTSRVPFFEDYTDHGVDHLNQVLATACALITDEAKEIFSGADAAVLTIAVLLHDSAMHLSEAGFKELIKGRWSQNKIDFFDKTAWPDLWDEFLFTAKRWDDNKLINVFGEEFLDQSNQKIRDPFENYSNLSSYDRKLIGEFIRINHPRIAHEMANFGVPGPVGDPITVNDRFGKEVKDIAGLIARSHGLPLRRCIDYLEKNSYHKREYQQVHAVYLMVLLRIADYLQIQADRADSVVFKYRHIPSKISQQEWDAHNAVRNITMAHDDPESIEVQVAPRNVKTFLRLQEWLAGIQDELDASWAVLGEVYGANKTLSKLGLILRRVRSNIDDVSTFSSSVDYVPKRIEFDVARPELLRLLIRPLYGNKPSIGIRELMQNAVDAVREMEAMMEKHPELRNIERLEQEGDVEIWLDDPDETGYAWLTISDKGTGMSEDIIKNYFLKAGASYRNSEAWKKEFEEDGKDDEGTKSRVLRSGRFGVGALAGFLLGEEMEVTTRHYSSNHGFIFSTKLNTEPIELKVVGSVRIGTSIKIPVPLNIYRLLLQEKYFVSIPQEWDWYVLNRPVVKRYIGMKKVELIQSHLIELDDEGKSTWKKIENERDLTIYWSFENAPSLACNGIFVTNSEVRKKFTSNSFVDNNYQIDHPNLIVLDANGILPLTLQRDKLTERAYSFESLLIKDIIHHWFAKILKFTSTEFNVIDNIVKLIPLGIRSNGYYGITNHIFLRLAHIFMTQTSVGLYCKSSFENLGLKKISFVVDFSKENNSNLNGFKIIFNKSKFDALFFYTSVNVYDSKSNFQSKHSFRRLLFFLTRDILNNNNHKDGKKRIVFRDIEIEGIRIVGDKKSVLDLFKRGEKNDETMEDNNEENQKILDEIENAFLFEQEFGDWVSIATHNCQSPLVDIGQIEQLKISKSNSINTIPYFEIFYKDYINFGYNNAMNSEYFDVFGNNSIPFDLEERKRLHKTAYEKLKYQLDRLEKKR